MDVGPRFKVNIKKKKYLWNIGCKAVENSLDVASYFLSHPTKFFLWVCRFSNHCILKIHNNYPIT
ncbi:hypothetical protein HanXRQr2_Chr03g0101671 [Helianthus annuus]|uniref:Uncharacterized protein n=1 Tax=Helianthus annuus TaxID=4232 RepID=A0A9K3JFH7_HELAN|nr:hypothetical protein HanXRQr2_Chr03g0101671 [Helianthus annuus]KAJ0942930.1 hypothetical protein HanPSC8_Chr03g0097991 [Helianthus annuus]